MNYDPKVFKKTVAIEDGSAESSPTKMDDIVICGIITPVEVAGTALTFKAGISEDALQQVYNSDGTIVTIPIDAERFIAIKPHVLAGAEVLSIVSDETADGVDEHYTLVGRRVI